MKKLLFTASIFCLILCSCSKKLNQSLITDGGKLQSSKSVENAHFHFLNVGSFILKVGEEVVVNDPFLSNHSLGKLMFTRFKTDTFLVDSILRNSEIANASLTLIGHGHYDHVMDILAFEKNIKNPNHKVVASQTVQNMLSPMNLRSAIIEIETKSASLQNQNPEWVYSNNNKLRVMAQNSWHPPHLMGKVLYSKPVKKPRKSSPSKISHYSLGQPLMYLIDFIENEKIVFRAFVQTSSEKHFDNYIPQTVWDEKSVDLAVVGLAMNSKRIDYATELINSLKPEFVFLCHWENFFKPYGYREKGVKKSDIEFNYNTIKQNLPQGSQLIMPGHNTKFEILAK